MGDSMDGSPRSAPHTVLNALPREEARAAFLRCCGAARWVDGMLDRIPFASTARLFESAREVFSSLSRDDFLEAFAHHPAIGEDVALLAERFPATAHLSGREQSGVSGASRPVLEALRDANVAYRERFGFTFIVCATGKTADEMLAMLRTRLDNDPAHELDIAAREQGKITELRLQKLAP
jgi:2-oxo-4-hydroxy-4-carboxy-5-ureidoimidazoline decarboxylase